VRRAGSSAMADEGVSEHDRRCITHVPDLSNMQVRYDAPAWTPCPMGGGLISQSEHPVMTRAVPFPATGSWHKINT
jgi:hypothetical protein